MTESLGVIPETPNLARMYDYFLGGSYNFDADRSRCDAVCGVLPCMTMLARSNRAFSRRVVRFMLGEGIEQFLDIGSGIPTAGNVHDVAQARNPKARVVYVDNEPIAVADGQRILAEVPNTAMIQADAREPATILGHPVLDELLNLDEPLGVLMGGVLVFIADEDDPAGLVASYRDALASGSFLAISHLTHDDADPATREQVDTMAAVYRSNNENLVVRDRGTFTGWFAGTELVSPGVTLLADWRPDNAEVVDLASPERMLGYGAVGRVP